MSSEYLALYRRFRPIKFSEVIGQDHIVNALKNQIKNNEIGHAYLFTGTRGTGKTSIAKIFAKAINCMHPIDGSPCGECEVCKALDDANMDIIEIDAASNNGVDDIREMRENLKFTPVNGRFKVYIIDEVHMLSINAFNALLKSIEEPPKHIVFILATTEVHKIPATILSRVQRFDFRLVSDEMLFNHLKYVFDLSNIKYEESALKQIVQLGEGSVRDTLSTAECVVSFGNKSITYNDVLYALGLNSKEVLLNIAKSIILGDLGVIFKEIDNANKLGKSMAVLSREITKTFRDLLVCKTCNNANEILKLPLEVFTKFKDIADNSEIDVLVGCMEKFTKTESEFRYSQNPKMLLEAVAVECTTYGENEQALKKNDKVSTETQTLKKNLKLPIEIWGQVITYLRERNEMRIFAVCGQLHQVDAVEDKIVVQTESESVFETLKSSEVEQLINSILNELDYEYTFKVEKIEKKASKSELKVQKLKEIFGDYLRIYD